MSKLFTENRRSFAKELSNNSLYIAFAGKAPLRTADEFYPFTPKRNFYYLTGIEKPAVMLVIHKDGSGVITETLYLERCDELVAKWDGAVLNKEAAEKTSGIEKYREIEQLEADMAKIFFSSDKLRLLLDLENRYFAPGHTPELMFAAKVRNSYPHVSIENAYPILAKLRTIKSKAEVKLIKKACEITGAALETMMKASKPGMFEYEYTAHFDYCLIKAGVKERAFSTIAASGKNAVILHYRENSDKVKAGDLILFDLGASFGYYAADISRTFPVNGKFTDRQKILYNIVLEAQKKAIAKIKHGVKYKVLNDTVIDHYAKELKRIGLIKDREEVSKYYYHGVGHHLGLDVHDVFRMNPDQQLKKGMVLTVEPGLYIAEEGVGIRIEDDILVTETGCEVLSSGIPKTVEEIEAAMAAKPRRTARS